MGILDRFRHQSNAPELGAPDIPNVPVRGIAELRRQVSLNWRDGDVSTYSAVFANGAAEAFEAALKDPDDALRALGSSAVFEARANPIEAGELFVEQALGREAEARWHIRIPLLQKAGVSIGEVSDLPPYHTEQAVNLWRSDEIARARGIDRGIGQALHIGTTVNVYYENETVKRLQEFEPGRPVELAVKAGVLVIADMAGQARAA